jgi:hypothetical protein
MPAVSLNQWSGALSEPEEDRAEPISRAPDIDFTPTRPATPTLDAQSGGSTRQERQRAIPGIGVESRSGAVEVGSALTVSDPFGCRCLII